MADEKNPKEASNIFHSIIKASVSKKASESKPNNDVAKQDKTKVKPKPNKPSDGNHVGNG